MESVKKWKFLVTTIVVRSEPPVRNGYPFSNGKRNGNGLAVNGQDGNGMNGNSLPSVPPSTSYGTPILTSTGYDSTSYENPQPPPSVPSSTGYASNPPSTMYGVPTQPAIIHKHVYVHVPPPEPEVIVTRPPIVVPPVQKHYKIVFIKAPVQPTPPPPVIPPPVQNEEKTIVYVLVRKPDDPPEIVIPTPVPTDPSKPEVFFIRYKTQRTTTNGYPNRVTPDYGPPTAVSSSSGYGGSSG